MFDLQLSESPLRGVFSGEQKTSQGSVPPAAASTTTGQVGSEQSTKTAARSNPQVQTFSTTLPTAPGFLLVTICLFKCMLSSVMR